MSLKVRELTPEELEEFHLYSHNSKGRTPYEPVWEGPDTIWKTEYMEGFTPIYRFYDCGANDLRVLRYMPTTDSWEAVNAPHSYINWYGLIWELVTNLNGYKRKLKETTN